MASVDSLDSLALDRAAQGFAEPATEMEIKTMVKAKNGGLDQQGLLPGIVSDNLSGVRRRVNWPTRFSFGWTQVEVR